MSIRRNTLTNLVGSIVPMFVVLFTVPQYLRWLGEARYGVMALVWLMLGYFSFLEMGLGKATSNQIAKAWNATPEERSEIFWSALGLNAVAGTVAAGFLWLAGDVVLRRFVPMDATFKHEVLSSLPWIAATFPLALVSSVLNGALEGRNRFFEVNTLSILTSAVFQIVPLAAARWISPSLAVVVPVAVVCRAGMNGFFFWTCQRAIPLVGPPNPSRDRAKSLLGYGGWVALTGLANPLLESLDRFVIGGILGAVAVTQYSIPMQLVGRIKVIPSALARALFPRLSGSEASESENIAVRSSLLTGILMTLISLFALALLRPFLNFWIGEKLSSVSTPIAEILIIGIWINSIAHIPYFYLQASGRPKIVAVIHLLEIGPYFAIIILAGQRFGLLGVAIAWSFRCIFEAVILLQRSHILSSIKKQLVIQGVTISIPIVMDLFLDVSYKTFITFIFFLTISFAIYSSKYIYVQSDAP